MIKKKTSSDPRQMTLFDLMVDQTNTPQKEILLLGTNTRNARVYEEVDGSRSYSEEPFVQRIKDINRYSPDALFRKRKYEFLTREELAAFQRQSEKKSEKQWTTLRAAVPLSLFGEQNAGTSNTLSGNRGPDTEAGNHSNGTRKQKHRSNGISDSGSLGTQSAERTGHAGIQRSPSGSESPVRTAGAGRERAGFGHGGGDADAGAQPVGNPRIDGDRYPRTNYRIRMGALGTGSAGTKLTDNLRAIKQLKELTDNGIVVADEAEKDILVRYAGWGGLPQIFDPEHAAWAGQRHALRGMLTNEEYAQARRSTQDACYTPESVIGGIYDGLARLGVNQDTRLLHVLEPAAGTGHFIGLCPPSWNMKWWAVEQDPISAQIARYLYPEAHILLNGFQHVSLHPEMFDLVVGNPPFGSQRLFDPGRPELRDFSIHNYFLIKSLDSLREGGIAAFVVSRFFLDAQSSRARERIASQAAFLGAIRLPDITFKESALIRVTADIVFFQKTEGPKDQQWVKTAPTSIWNEKRKNWEEQQINSYFLEHPEQMIGKLHITDGAFTGTINCIADDGINLTEEIRQRLNVLPENIFTPSQEPTIILPEAENPQHQKFLEFAYFRSLKPESLCVNPHDGQIMRKTVNGMGDATCEIVPIKRDSERARLAGMIDIRDALRNLLNAEKNPYSDENSLKKLRQELNFCYDVFIAKYGLLNSSLNRSLIREDPEAALIQSLEFEYDKGISIELARKTGRKPRKSSAKKAPIFFRRVLESSRSITHAENVRDAMLICLREKGRIFFPRIAELTGGTEKTVQTELQRDGLVFLNPASGDWEIRDHYLSGNVREKLRQARGAAENDANFAINVSALEAILPPDVEAADIGIQFGATWIPPEDMELFITEVIGQRREYVCQAHVDYHSLMGKWHAKIRIYDRTLNSSIWGIPEYPAEKILEALFANHPIKVEKEVGRDAYGNAIREVDQEATAAAMQKADEIRRAFQDWIWEDDERRQRLVERYNERFNTHVPPKYDGSHMELAHANPGIILRPHQKDAIWRGIQEGTGLFDHVVGAGKTLVCIATAMESKRMGLIKKPMIIVPNHLTYQWRDEFYRLYPDANILVADKSDFEKRNRERFLGRIVTGDWDAVIIAHSSFGKIETPLNEQREILTEQIEMTVSAIDEIKNKGGVRTTIKQLEKWRERLKTRHDELMSRLGTKDRAVDFSDLGVDMLFVDESQEFKNLAFQTSMNVSGLGNVAGSGKAFDLFVKCRYLQRKNDGRGVFFMTGTPISNSIAEVYTLQRYLQYDELQKKEIGHFDAWASAYGQIRNGWELDATGMNYKLQSRFAKFQNVPELLCMYRSFADVITKKDIDRQEQQTGGFSLTPPVRGGAPRNIVADRSSDQERYMQSIIARMEHLPPDSREDNPLKITNDARKAGLDFRLIDSQASDFIDSKINIAVNRIHEIWQDTTDVLGTQLVFCDLSTPKQRKKTNENFPSENEMIIDMEEIPEEDESIFQVPDMDTQLAGQSDFSVYDDMRQKLVRKGIPEEEIAFIHEFNTAIRKAKLFADMNAGRVRVLFGSTAKLGAGTNVQQRLVAAHHLDAPWRPSDLEQRNGRILRQGNKLYEADQENFQVEINYYATKRTYDARMWQTIEYKSTAIEQFRKGDLFQRVIDDVQSEAATAAEMKAAASGNPLILIQVQLAADLRKLEALHVQHQRTQHRLRDRLKYLRDVEKRLDAAHTLYKDALALRDAHTHYDLEKGEKKIHQEFFINDKLFDIKNDKKTVQEQFKTQINKLVWGSPNKGFLIGTYRGFNIEVLKQRADGKEFLFALKGGGTIRYPGNLHYIFGESFSLSGFFQRVDNFLDKGLEQIWEDAQILARQELTERATVEARAGEAFPQMEELELVRRNHNAVLHELKCMQDDKNYVSEWIPLTLEAFRAERQTVKEQMPMKPEETVADVNEKDMRKPVILDSSLRPR